MRNFESFQTLIEPTLQNCRINATSFWNEMKKDRYNRWIYPAEFQEKFHISLRNVYKIFELCDDYGFVQPYLQIRCPRCQGFIKDPIGTALSLPYEVKCPKCSYTISNPLKYAIVIYKML